MLLIITPVASSEDACQSAGATKEEGEQEGQGEEDVLPGSVGVETLVVRYQENGGERDAAQQDGRYTQGTDNAHLANYAVGVEEQEAEPVYREHRRNAEEGQKRVEDGAGIERAPDVSV